MGGRIAGDRMKTRTARAIREAVIIARSDHRFIAMFTSRRMQDRVLRSLLTSGGPSSAIGGSAYAVALTRITRKARKAQP